jgi:hypothetical protein
MGLSFHTAGQSNASAWRFDTKQWERFMFVASEEGPLRCNTEWENAHWNEMVKKKDKDAAEDEVKRKLIAMATLSSDQDRQDKTFNAVDSNVGAKMEVPEVILDALDMKYMLTYDSEDSSSDE